MRYTVVWDPRPTQDLADIWTRAPDRQAVADAADEIDRVLRGAPLSVGAAHGDDRRLTVSPLEVIYTVSPGDRLVTILHVWHQ